MMGLWDMGSLILCPGGVISKEDLKAASLRETSRCINGGHMQRAKLMQLLWEKSEAASNDREKKLLEIAGNLVEATFTSDPLSLAIYNAVQGVLNDEVKFLDE
jgi:hypothetical protein